MKAIKLIACLLLLSSQSQIANACSYYPYGEDIRFSLFSPNISDEMDLEALFYSATYLNQYSFDQLRGPNENIDEWYSYLDGAFEKVVIDELIYKSSYNKPSPKLNANQFYNFLKKEENVALKEYLLFAKKIEHLLYTDYWDTKTAEDIANSKIALEIAVNQSQAAKTEWLKLRYAYQGVVLAYYLKADKRVISIYDNEIAPLKSESIIAKWSLFYKANNIDDKYERYRLWAIIFEKSRTKNEYIFKRFPTGEAEVAEILEHCQSNEEKAAVYGILAFKNPARAYDQIVKMVDLNPKTSLLNLLLVREINKMEDWYYTDRYTGYGRAVQSYWYGSEDDIRFKFIDEKNFEADKKYLTKIKRWATNISTEKTTTNKGLWFTSLAYMSFMLDDAAGVNFYSNKANKYDSDKVIKAELKTIELLSFVKFNPVVDTDYQDELYEKLDEIKLYKNELYNYDRFRGQIMMAISRKYLEHNNVVMAALFETKVDGGTQELYQDWDSQTYQAFNLLNQNAQSSDMDAFFELWNKKEKTNLETYLLDGLEPFEWRFTDLWGTTYLREDNLEMALKIYETIPDSVWQVTNHDYHYYYQQELNANPFETRFSSSAMSEDRTSSYTKPEFVRKLIDIKKEAETNTKDRAYNYMLLGNAYYNMTYNGNSWYYTEYAWSTSDGNQYYAVNHRYRNSGQNTNYVTGDRAKKYYKLAEETSKNPEFSAFCYRLQFKCLTLRTSFAQEKHALSKYKERFIDKYPKFVIDLNGCDRFGYYFSKWKDA
ncbi:MAG: hypothetical protein GQ574_21125 [Crocinitomix sp.]|nr:hypothetical protein [Crocinitomix sp.]